MIQLKHLILASALLVLLVYTKEEEADNNDIDLAEE